MKLRAYMTLSLLAGLFVGYLFYLYKPASQTVVDVSKSERFKVYKKTSGKPMNIELSVRSSTDSAFNIRVMGLPVYAELFNVDFTQKLTNYSRKIDYYSGKGIEVIYTPKGTTKGNVDISVSVN